jgi:tetratricopeptide (TPR) repeat protein
MICSAQIKESEFQTAMNFILSGDEAKALSTIESFEKKFPTDSKVLFLRGFYQFRDGNQNAAMMSFSNVIKTNPKFALAFGARAQLFSTKGMLDKAIGDISEAIKLEPKNIDFLNTRVGYYFENKQFVEALADTKTEIKLDPNIAVNYFDAADFTKLLDPNADTNDYFNQAYATKGIPKVVTDLLFAKHLFKYSKYEDAKSKYETALSANEKDFSDEDFHTAALVYYKLNDYNKAISLFTKAIALQPNNVNYNNNLCSVYIELKDWQKVKETAENSIRQGTNDPMAHMLYAIGLKYTGFENLALEYEKKSKQLQQDQNK